MDKKDSNRTKQINDILSVVKLSSLLFSGMAFLEHFVNNDKVMHEFTESFYIIMAVSEILVLSLIYCIWEFSTIHKFSNKNIRRIQIAENFIFVFVFFTVILLSGAQKSEFKFLFLFAIITTTIQCGVKFGMTVASISSFSILAMDIFCAPNLTVNQYFQNDLIIAGVFILTAWPLGFYVKIANEHIEELKNLANVDGLTGVYNHRYFHEILKEKIVSCEKDSTPISMIFMDIDYFKNYNDLYGHQSGDEVLKTIGNLLKKTIGKDDIAARYGGEEFALILPDTSEKEAIKVAENIRKIIEETYFEGEENQPNGKITVSIGISVYPDKAKNDVELIKSADDALYRAKFFIKTE